MLSWKSPIHSPALLSNQTTPASWPWHSLVLGHMIFSRPRASPPIDVLLGHPLLHMQLETQLVSSYCCSSYRVTDPFSSLGTFSSSFIIWWCFACFPPSVVTVAPLSLSFCGLLSLALCIGVYSWLQSWTWLIPLLHFTVPWLSLL